MDRCGRGCCLTFRTVGCLPGSESGAVAGFVAVGILVLVALDRLRKARTSEVSGPQT
jgi:hypothetical protein